MNLDEAIKHCEEVARQQMARADALDEIPLFGMDENDGKQIEACYKCAEEHRQLAEWLKDYKRLKEQTEITWVAGTDGAKVAFWDVPIPKVLKICEILQEPIITSTEDNAEMIYPQVEGITPTDGGIGMTQTVDLIHKMAEFFKSEEFFKKGEDARLELSPDDVRCMNEIIKALPSIKPQEPHWIYIRTSVANGLKIVECSECGKRTYGSGNYCPNCGARMIEPQESEVRNE